MNLFDLFAKISLDTKDYEKGIQKSKSSLKTFSAAFGTAIKTTANLTKEITSVGNTAANVFAGLVTTASGGIVALGKVGLDYNAQIESYVTNFTTMLGDAEKAALKVDEIKTMAAKTPFGLSDLASATQTLLAFGIESDKTTGIMQQLGDISLGNAERFQSLTLAFSQATSAGKLAGQDLLQMINAGFNPLSQLVDETGLSVGQLKELMSGLSGEAAEAMRKTAGITEYGRKLISQGYISADDLAYALDLATRKGGQFFGGMESASKTVSGLISTLQDDATALVGQVFEPASDKLKNDLLPNALEYVATLSEAYGEKGLSGLIDGASDIFAEIVVEATEQAPKLVKTATGTVKQIISAVKKRKKEIREAGVTLFKEITGAFEETVDETLPLIEEFVPDIAEGFLEYGGLMFETGGNIIMSVARGLSANAPELSGTLVSVVQSGLDFVDDNAEEFATAGFNIITALATGVGENLPNFASTGVSILSKLGESFTSEDGKKKLKDGAGALVDGLLDSLEVVITAENVSGFLTAGAEFIDSFLEEVTNDENIDKIEDTAIQIAKSLADGIVDSLPSLWELINKWGTRGREFSLNFAKDFLTDAGEFVMDAIGLDGVNWNDVGGDFGPTTSTETEYIEDAATRTKNYNKNLTNDMIKDLESRGDTYQINVYAPTDSPLTLAETVAEKLHQMKEREAAIYG